MNLIGLYPFFKLTNNKKTEALAPVSPVCCIQFSMLLLLHPIINLIRNLQADLRLLLARQGMACIL